MIDTRSLCTAALVLLLPSLARAEPESVPQLLARLDRAAAGVGSLRGEFTQKSRVKLFKQELRSTGSFAFERPRRVRWQYLAPDASTLILDGDKGTLRAEGMEPRAFDLHADPALRAVFDQLAMWLGGGALSSLQEGYAVVAAGSAAEPVLLLEPRAGTPVARTFSRIELRFDRRLLLRAILLREPGGDEKEITFGRLEPNARLPAGTFSP